MLAAEGIVLIRRNRRERSRTAHARLGLHLPTSRLDEHEKALRQTTLFSMVSSNWGDSFGSEHLLSDI
jgi:hypothetical protein